MTTIELILWSGIGLIIALGAGLSGLDPGFVVLTIGLSVGLGIGLVVVVRICLNAITDLVSGGGTSPAALLGVVLAVILAVVLTVGPSVLNIHPTVRLLIAPSIVLGAILRIAFPSFFHKRSKTSEVKN